jgi:hypothetical protein
MKSYGNPSLFDILFIPTTPLNTTPHYIWVRQRQGRRGKKGLRIDEDDQRRDRVLRESPKANTNNTISERML